MSTDHKSTEIAEDVGVLPDRLLTTATYERLETAAGTVTNMSGQSRGYASMDASRPMQTHYLESEPGTNFAPASARDYPAENSALLVTFGSAAVLLRDDANGDEAPSEHYSLAGT